MKKLRLTLISIALGTLTCFAISALGNSDIANIFSMPGVVIASVFWPEGIHSNGAEYFLVSFIALDVLFYSLLWLGLLSCGQFIYQKFWKLTASSK